ncbi:hypothetical protein WISP_81840 [Willisornis vidua]|uniref:XPG-I domain-containing protein n=1 Tax=Willisornis vidua TaxID=1566151 RepID=A0ABQ9D9E4_9PASS|nr:hypothetical protein WISP_81840 [Willisornis vidua]
MPGKLESVRVPELTDIFFNDLADGKVRVLIIFANVTWLGGNADLLIVGDEPIYTITEAKSAGLSVVSFDRSVDMLKVVGCVGGCGLILSLVLACSMHPYPKPVYLHLPLRLLIASHTSVCHMDKLLTAQLSEWWENVKVIRSICSIVKMCIPVLIAENCDLSIYKHLFIFQVSATISSSDHILD